MVERTYLEFFAGGGMARRPWKIMALPVRQ
jgi:hypothetical protein